MLRGRLGVLPLLLVVFAATASALEATYRCTNALLTDFAEGSYKAIEGIVYDTSKGRELKGDLYLPIGKGPFPIVLFIHGGGWVAGARGQMNSVVLGKRLACAGFAFFDIDYILAPEQQFPKLTQDCKCALRFIKGEAKKYNLDPSRVAVTGGSAGGHLTAMVALTADDPFFDPTCPVHPEQSLEVQAAIPWYPITDFASLKEFAGSVGLFEGYLGKEATEETIRKASPISYPAKKKPGEIPPFLFIHGEKDALAPFSESVKLKELLEKHGHKAELYAVKEANHAFDAGISDPRTLGATRALIDFLQRTLK